MPGVTRSSSFGSASASHQDFKDIRSRCLSEGRLFEDPEFPAIDGSINIKIDELNEPIIWLRPREISDNPQLFVEGFSRFDMEQGILGDCWLVAAMANLTLHRKLFLQVVPDDQSFDEEYAGVFHFRFWQYGQWVDVVIDDRLPTYRGKLMFLQSSQNNEFWSALLEKAYAKLHGSYKALKGGSACEAMVDFTGGVSENYDIAELPPNFYIILLQAYERNSLISCSTELGSNNPEAETSVGLINGHAYSVTCVQYVDVETLGRVVKMPMLRLRNPWGNEAEWSGVWSDKSPAWRFISESEKKELGLISDDDGEFWMYFEDLCQHFAGVEICHLIPDSLDPEECPEGCTKKRKMSVIEGEWVRGVTAGGCRNYLYAFWKNPQYNITLKDVDEGDEENKCTITVALMQKNRRRQGLECLSIGFIVYRLPDNGHVPKPLDVNFFNNNIQVGATNEFLQSREVSTRLKLDPGSYVIVPSTFKPDEEGEFLLRVVSENDINMVKYYEDTGMGDVDDMVRKLFNRLAGEVNWQKLKIILDHSMREATPNDISANKFVLFSEDVCRSIIALFDKDGSGKIDFIEFEGLLIDLRKWKEVFLLYDTDGRGAIPANHLRDALHSAGYTVNAHVLNVLVHRYGSDDGYIHFNDFVMCFVRLKTMIDIFQGRSLDGKHAKFSLEEWLCRTVYS